MNDKKVIFRFSNSDRVIETNLSIIVFNMGHQCAEDVSLKDEIGEPLAFVVDNWDHVIIEIL